MKRLRHKETGMIYRHTPVMARLSVMEEVDIPQGTSVELPPVDNSDFEVDEALESHDELPD